MDQAFLKEYLLSKIRLSEEVSARDEFQQAYLISNNVVDAIAFYRTYWNTDLAELFVPLIAAQPAYQLVLAITALQLHDRGMKDAAAYVAGTAAALNIPGNFFQILHARMLREAGNLAGSRAICKDLLEIRPGDDGALSELSECDMEDLFLSDDYYRVLSMVHTTMKPATYLEIGVAQGRSMALVREGTVAIGVDPETAEEGRMFYYSPEIRPHLFRQTSDAFFEEHDVPSILGQPTVDVAFIDGLHQFEQVLRDFINIERLAGPSSVVLIHDCLPINDVVAARERQTSFWVGDVWKIIPCLKMVRPDLEIVTLPVKPSGLAVIKKLDPMSRVLERQFDSIVEHFGTLQLPETWAEKRALCCVTDETPEHVLGAA